jgi:hypothetical protein
MSTIIYSYIKVFREEEHRDDFINGKLFMNRLSVFKGYEDAKENNIGDRFEAVSGWYQPTHVSLEIAGIEVPSADISAPISVQMESHNNLNIFCMYAVHSNEVKHISEETIDDFREHMKISAEIENLGDYCAIVYNCTEFNTRTLDAIKKYRFSGSMGLVKYYDPETFSGNIEPDQAAFHKQLNFKHQKEYRIAIDRQQPGLDHFLLNIGNISDICITCKTSEINSMLEINLPQDV